MILIFGGSYNGKIEYCRQKYNLKDEDIFFCKNESMDFTKKAICGLHIFIRSCIEKKTEPLNYIEANIDKFKDKIIICDECNSGIVPIKKEDRFFREEYGQSMQYLSSKAEEVYRIFFGLVEKLK